MSEGKNFDLRIISLGAGVQSSAMYRMAALGMFDVVPDYAIFADTQNEPAWVYEQLDLLEKDHGHVIPILRPTRGDLLKDITEGIPRKDGSGVRFPSVPFWTQGQKDRPVPGRRHCTRDYKIDVVRGEIRRVLGLKPRARAKGRFLVEEWIGISTDEATRAKPSRIDWIKSRWPLLYDIPTDRQGCLDFHAERGYPLPKKSACTFCPYRSTGEYANWRDNYPELFEEACRVDDLLRNPLSVLSRGMKNPQYVWRGLQPLRELPPTEELDEKDQMDLFDNECEGMCGV